MKRFGVLDVLGMCALVVGAIGLTTTLYAYVTVQDQLDTANAEYSRLLQELHNLESKNEAVLSQAQEIARRSEDVGLRIEATLNDALVGDTSGVVEVSSLFKEDNYNCSVWGGQLVGAGSEYIWRFCSAKQVGTQQVPLAWELLRDSEVVGFAVGYYSVSSGKVVDVFDGSYLDEINWESTIEGNTPDTGV